MRKPLIAIVLLGYSCNIQQEKPILVSLPAKSTASIIFLEEQSTAHALNSIGEIKNFLVSELEIHESDTAYQRYMVLIDTISGSEYQAEIVIGQLFHPSRKSAVLAWSVTDTSMDIEVYDLQKNVHRSSIFVATNQPSFKSGISLRSAFLFFRDYNYDGWQDLEVVIDAWDGIDIGFRSRLWLVQAGSFRPVRNFENIASPELDPVKRQICSYQSGGCADMAMHFSVWQLKKNTVKMIRSIGVDCCVGSNGHCLITIDRQKSIAVAGNKVHLYVPSCHRAWIKEKMQK